MWVQHSHLQGLHQISPFSKSPLISPEFFGPPSTCYFPGLEFLLLPLLLSPCTHCSHSLHPSSFGNSRAFAQKELLLSLFLIRVEGSSWSSDISITFITNFGWTHQEVSPEIPQWHLKCKTFHQTPDYFKVPHGQRQAFSYLKSHNTSNLSSPPSDLFIDPVYLALKACLDLPNVEREIISNT